LVFVYIYLFIRPILAEDSQLRRHAVVRHASAPNAQRTDGRP